MQVYRVRLRGSALQVAALALPDKPSIAVLPFEDMSGDPEQEYFADGMVRVVRRGSEMVTNLSDRRISARLKLVDEHVRMENQHDLDGIMGTFGKTARYDDEPWDAHYTGRDQVRTFYSELLMALPDLHIKVAKCHASDDAIVLEAVIAGHHRGAWRGLPPTGWPVEFPLCAVFSFDEADRLAGEKIYYDRATVLRQLGVFHDPEHAIGRVNTILMHPLTVARFLRWKVSRKA